MDIKKHITALGFVPKDGTNGIYHKIYVDYAIEIDFEKQSINYGGGITADSKTTQNFSDAENFVVLECVDRLLTKGYKPQNLILEKTWPSGHGTSGRLDICVNREDGTPYMLIECKTYGKEYNKELARIRKDGGQLFTYFQLSGGKADVLMLYASELKGNKFVYVNEIIKIEDDYRNGDVKDIYEKWNKLTKDNGIFGSWVQPYNFQSKALTKEQLKEIKADDSSFIFNRFLEILRHNVVSDKGNAFNKIFTLFLCKVYDETTTGEGEELKFQWLEGRDNHVDFQLRLTDLYSKGMKKFLDRTVSDFNNEDFDKRCANLNEDTKQYLLREVNKLRLEKNNEFAIKEVYDNASFEENAKVVKEVVELIQGYRIRYNKRQQYLSDFFELLLTTGLKQEAGQYFTPVPIAQFIIKSLPLDSIMAEKLSRKDGEILPYMIDYAAGSGHFITEFMHEIQDIINACDTSKYIEETRKHLINWQNCHFDWATNYVYGIEKDYRLVKVGKVGCYLHGDGLANVILSDGLANFCNNKEYKGKLRKQVNDGQKDNQQFDIVLSNPPYSVSSFRQTTRDYYTEQDFELYNSLTDNSSEIECLFIERTKQLLKDGGIAGVILPSSILSNSGIYTKAREIILQYFDIVSIAELGSNTFMATNTNTVVLFLRRRDNYFAANTKSAVDTYFRTLNDVTINGIETPASKYVAHVWEGLDYTDYITLLQKLPNDKVKAHEIYAEYKKKISAKNDAKLYEAILNIEAEKLLYFILAYSQKVVIVKSGEKDVEKRFLGYEFSNRRGNEGIHAIQKGKNIDECTQLFDTNSYDNPEKASSYVYRAFKGDYTSPIAEGMQSHISRVSLIDMLTFDRPIFEKGINLNSKKKVAFDSRYTLKPIDKLASFQSGLWKGEKGVLQMTKKHFRLILPDEGQDIFMLRKGQEWGYRYGPSIMVHDGICEGWFASPGDCFEADWFTYRRSTDGGKTWGAYTTVFPEEGTFCRQPIQVLSNGRWIFANWLCTDSAEGLSGDPTAFRISDDEGKTWRMVMMPGSNGHVHANVIELEPGHLVAFMRNREAYRIHRSESFDWGETWTVPAPTPLPNNNSSISAVKLQSGRIAIAYNPTCTPNPVPGKAAWPGLRCPVAVALSEDGGLTFPIIRWMERGEGYMGDENKTNNKQYEYPYLMQGRDGMLHLAYAARTRQGIKYVRFSEQDVLGAKRETVGLYNPTAAQSR